MKLPSLKLQLIIFLIIFAFSMAFIDKDFTFLLSTLIAIISAIIIDSLFKYLKEKEFLITESSVISGLIIGYVLSSDNNWQVFLLAPLFAICSKHLIRIGKKHLFNPAAFGILLTIIFFRAETQWKGTYIWYILVPFGLYFVFKIKKIQILISYIIIFITLFAIQALIKNMPLLNILGYLSYFYIFIMLIEPNTTPINKVGQIIFGAGVAILVFVFTEIGVRFDAELCALLIFNAALPLLSRLPYFKNLR